MFLTTLSDISRFESRINKTDSCWLWTGSSSSGYGTFGFNRVTVKAASFSYKLYVGPILNKLWVLHKCDVPACVNPEHLFLGTQMDNVRDMMKKGRQYIGKRCILPKKQQEKVLYLFGNTNTTKQTIADSFGVSQSVISRIIKRDKYIRGLLLKTKVA